MTSIASVSQTAADKSLTPSSSPKEVGLSWVVRKDLTFEKAIPESRISAKASEKISVGSTSGCNHKVEVSVSKSAADITKDTTEVMEASSSLTASPSQMAFECVRHYFADPQRFPG